MADKEHAIKVMVFAKDNEATQHFVIAVLTKTGQFSTPRSDLEFFQWYKGGLWINHEDKVHIRKDEDMVLQLLGGHVATAGANAMQPLVLGTSSSVILLKNLIDLSISDDDEDDLYAPIGGLQLEDIALLPPPVETSTMQKPTLPTMVEKLLSG
ncbi:hypothetical protein F5146DRAFT_1146691 [Armillaria mellea]|nr:hypothetical protein F5146DRAFT_1146691 [Armillaria mellea]